MARPIRIQYPGAVYHVMARGNHGQKIFADDADRKSFLSALAGACAKTGWRIDACVLRCLARLQSVNRPGTEMPEPAICPETSSLSENMMSSKK